MFEQVCAVIADALSCDGADLTPETRLLEDLGADSLDAIELNVALEEALNVKITDEALAQLKTVGDIVACIETATLSK